MWSKFDDGCPNNRKILSVSPLAAHLWDQSIMWSNHELTDGFVPRRRAITLIPTVDYIWAQTGAVVQIDDLIQELVTAKLWEAAEGGYRVHDFLEYQFSREEVEEVRRTSHSQQAEAGRIRARAAERENGKFVRKGKEPHATAGAPEESPVEPAEPTAAAGPERTAPPDSGSVDREDPAPTAERQETKSPAAVDEGPLAHRAGPALTSAAGSAGATGGPPRWASEASGQTSGPPAPLPASRSPVPKPGVRPPKPASRTPDLVRGSGGPGEDPGPARRPGDGSPTVLAFPIVGPGTRTWELTQDHVHELQGVFPNLDVVAELKICHAKVQAGGISKKTRGGMDRALLNWLTYAQNRGYGAKKQNAQGRLPPGGLEAQLEAMRGGAES